MRLAILQSNYIPWKGYFDLMSMADLFVVYDSVQYTKNDWRNRNMLPSSNGTTWLTIAVATSSRGGQQINEATISDSRWSRKHWSTVQQLLGKRPEFDRYKDRWSELYAEAAAFDLLHDVNVHFLRVLADQLGISTPIVDDREYDLAEDSPTGRLVQLCELVGADSYVTGAAGLSYLEVGRFREAHIALEVIDYGHYPEYPQASASFQHGVSVLDLLANVGPSASEHLTGKYRVV